MSTGQVLERSTTPVRALRASLVGLSAATALAPLGLVVAVLWAPAFMVATTHLARQSEPAPKTWVSLGTLAIGYPLVWGVLWWSATIPLLPAPVELLALVVVACALQIPALRRLWPA